MTTREGSLEAPVRYPIDWRSPEYTDAAALDAELERVFEICHGCRRCFNLCNTFPTLFDLVDESSTGEVDAVDKADFAKVVEHCYLCDMCYMTKCPYVPPHEWNVDFPHLMLRARASRFRAGETSARDKWLSATDAVGRIAGIPVVAGTVNALTGNSVARGLLENVAGIDREAPLPTFTSPSARKRLGDRVGRAPADARAGGATQGRLAVFTTCYGNRNVPGIVEDLVAILEHNDIPVTLPTSEHCCGMPKLELGDLESIERLKERNIPVLLDLVDAGWDLTACIPSCVLMFKQELPLLFPDDEQVRAVARAFYDPFEYLLIRHKAGLLKTDFRTELGSISYQVPCHLRVQNIGLKTRDVLELVPNTTVKPIERCSGHDGTYAVKREFGAISRKIARPVARQADQAECDHFTSDCPLAAAQIETVSESCEATHPLQLLRQAYGI